MKGLEKADQVGRGEERTVKEVIQEEIVKSEEHLRDVIET